MRSTPAGGISPCSDPTRQRRCDGVAAIEMALVTPILVVLALAMVDFGLGIYTKMLVGDAADAGAAYAFRNGSSYSTATATTFNAAIAAAATGAVTVSPVLSSVPLTAVATETYCCAGMTQCSASTSPSCASGYTVGTYVKVTATATYSTFLPYTLLTGLLAISISNPVPLTAVSTVRIQ
ncbi:MAG TPA: TadE family protein [Stellaceae bacterium]|nr:TadE family protein [Stellaceae bacterium]